MTLTEQFQTIEQFQRYARDDKHETLFNQNARNDLKSFSQTQISNFVKQATDKQLAFQRLIEKSKLRSNQHPHLLKEKAVPAQLLSKQELAAQFLPASVKQSIEEQQDKDPVRRKAKRLNQLHQFMAESFRQRENGEGLDSDGLKAGSDAQTDLYTMNPVAYISK